jgi:hypothetical protein
MKFESNGRTSEESSELFTSFDLAKVKGSYYDLLGVDPTSTSLQVREAYFRLKATYTDSNQAIYSLMSGSDLADKIKSIEVAFDVLRDVDSRSKYNENIGIVERAGASRTDILIENISFPPVDEALRKASRPVKDQKIRLVAGQIHRDSNLAERIKTIFESAETPSGMTLKAMREAAFVTFEEIEANTKVAQDKISLIENDDFLRMPPSVYVKGFLKSILSYYGISDSKAFIDGYTMRVDACLKKTK